MFIIADATAYDWVSLTIQAILAVGFLLGAIGTLLMYFGKKKLGSRLKEAGDKLEAVGNQAKAHKKELDEVKDVAEHIVKNIESFRKKPSAEKAAEMLKELPEGFTKVNELVEALKAEAVEEIVDKIEAEGKALNLDECKTIEDATRKIVKAVTEGEVA